jgi:exodeoxyribonuclease VII large subunit
MKDRLTRTRQKLELAVNTLESSSPLAILERGYAVVQDAESGAIIRRASEAAPGKLLQIRPMEGLFTARTETILAEGERDGNKKL